MVTRLPNCSKKTPSVGLGIPGCQSAISAAIEGSLCIQLIASIEKPFIAVVVASPKVTETVGAHPDIRIGAAVKIEARSGQEDSH